MPQKEYSEKELAKLIADVEKEFTAHLAKSEEVSLAKSEEKDSEDKKEEHKEEHKEEPKHEAKDEESKEHEGESHDEPKHEEPKHDEHQEHQAEGHEGHDYDEEDMAHMEKMYRSMSKGELAAHHSSIQKCMSKGESSEMSKNEAEGHKSGGEIAACEPKDGPGSKSPEANADGTKMEKSENVELELLKSELAAEKAEKTAIKEFLTAFVKKSVPQGKAITSLEVISKSEAPSEDKALTKSEITKILNTKMADPSLKKSDRDAVTSFYLNGQVNVNSISHLLK